MDSQQLDQFPEISIIMPTYNNARYIGEAIDSVFSQTYDNYELIIIDNYSIDEMVEVVTSYQSSKIKLIRFSNNGIIDASRNVGIRASKGKYIAFLDSDDLWLPEKLTRQVVYMERHLDLDLVYGLAKSIGNPLFEGRLVAQPKGSAFCSTFEGLFISNSIVCMTVMARASSLKRVGLFNEDPNFVRVEDWDLWLRIAHDYKIGFIPEVLGFHRVHAQNVSKDETSYLKPLNVIKKYENMSWVSQELVERSRYSFYFAAAMSYLYLLNREMRSHFLKVFIGSSSYFLRLKAFCGLYFSYLPKIIQRNLLKLFCSYRKSEMNDRCNFR
ncbi:MAG: glycosyltransferase [Candidatus Scalindua rubra]|uniref:Glycosyltransferase n=1 Tax=Candidatus Scalindua rubra TaxID=1872076 RepID=A0A1E3X8S1_9BACT|nr:MAG: glycosyltransferase [Candidatus Scalindua rubra]